MTAATQPHRMAGPLGRLGQLLPAIPLRTVQGRITAATGTIIRAVMPNVRVGELCHITDETGLVLMAEVVGLAGREALLTPIAPRPKSGGHNEPAPWSQS